MVTKLFDDDDIEEFLHKKKGRDQENDDIAPVTKCQACLSSNNNKPTRQCHKCKKIYCSCCFIKTICRDPTLNSICLECIYSNERKPIKPTIPYLTSYIEPKEIKDKDELSQCVYCNERRETAQKFTTIGEVCQYLKLINFSKSEYERMPVIYQSIHFNPVKVLCSSCVRILNNPLFRRDKFISILFDISNGNIDRNSKGNDESQKKKLFKIQTDAKSLEELSNGSQTKGNNIEDLVLYPDQQCVYSIHNKLPLQKEQPQEKLDKDDDLAKSKQDPLNSAHTSYQGETQEDVLRLKQNEMSLLLEFERNKFFDQCELLKAINGICILTNDITAYYGQGFTDELEKYSSFVSNLYSKNRNSNSS